MMYEEQCAIVEMFYISVLKWIISILTRISYIKSGYSHVGIRFIPIPSDIYTSTLHTLTEVILWV